jgi:hypothetical protein
VALVIDVEGIKVWKPWLGCSKPLWSINSKKEPESSVDHHLTKVKPLGAAGIPMTKESDTGAFSQEIPAKISRVENYFHSDQLGRGIRFADSNPLRLNLRSNDSKYTKCFF